MARITNQMIQDQYLKETQKQQNSMMKTEKKIQSQSRIDLPEDDPIAAVKTMIEKSQLKDLDRFQRNIDFSKGRILATEEAVQQISPLLREAKELAVQGANGTYSKEDTYAMAMKVNALLENIYQIANTEYQGTPLFGGTQVGKTAYTVEMGRVLDSDQRTSLTSEPLIQKIHYQGDNGHFFAEIQKGKIIPTNVLGSELFTTMQEMVVSSVDSNNYVLSRPQDVLVQGKELRLQVGDTLDDIVTKINDLQTNVLASVQENSGQRYLTLETHTPGGIYVEDIRGGTLFQDLGILDSTISEYPHPFANTANRYSENLFDTLIQLRDALLRHDTSTVNESLGNIDTSIDQVGKHLSKIGSHQVLIENTEKAIAQKKMIATEVLNKVSGVDTAEAIMELKQLESDYLMSLKLGNKLLSPSLLDFLD